MSISEDRKYINKYVNFCYRVYETGDLEECQTPKFCVLVDEIEKDLRGLQNYRETHSYISDAMPELKPFLESKVVPVTGYRPTWYFQKKWYAKLTQSHSHWFQNFVCSRSTSMELKMLSNNIIPFSMRYIKLFLVTKSLLENPKPDKITPSSTIAFTGCLPVHSHIIKAFGECKDVEYASIHHLFDELLPLNFLHYSVVVRS